MHARELGAEGLGAHDGTNALDLVGGQANPDTGAADQDAQIDVAVGYGFAHLVAGDGVIKALGGVGAKVHDLAAALLQVLGNDVLELDGGVVVADTDLHEWFLSGPCGGIAKGFTAFDCMIARLLPKHSGVFWSNALADANISPSRKMPPICFWRPSAGTRLAVFGALLSNGEVDTCESNPLYM